MQKPGCSKCAETTVQGRAYIDKKTGLLCVTLDEKYEKARRHKSISTLYMYNLWHNRMENNDTIEDKK